MAYYDQVFYANAGDQSTTGHYAVAKRPQNTAVVAGQLCRQFTAPAVGNERVFVCIVAGTTANVTDATWTLTRGAKTTDGTVTWQEVTGIAAVNGDATNTVNWTAAKAVGTPTLGTVIKRANAASYWICSTAGTLGASEPAWPNDTAGTTQADGTTTWTCLGAVGNFTGGQAPHARLANVFTSTWFATGNTVYVGDNHAESQTTSITITPTGSATTIGRLLCHNHSGNYPPAGGDLTTGAAVSATGGVGITYNPGGVFYTYGVTFKAGVGSGSGTFLILNSTVNTMGFYDNCSFWIASTQATNNIVQINASSGSNQCNWNNCTVKFANAANTIGVQSGSFTWQNTGQVLASGSVVPTALFVSQSSGTYTNLTLEVLDLSQINTNIFGSNQSNEAGTRIIKDCKFNAAITVQQSGVTTLGLYEQVVRSDSGATAYKSARYSYDGTETTETAITRVGGAADPAGQAQSRKIVTTANSQWVRPFRAEPYAIWNPTTGANVTVTVYGTINAGALPNNDDIWMEVEYLGDNPVSGTTVTFNAATATNITLSNGNLTATPTSNTQGAISGSLSRTSGKFYFEVTCIGTIQNSAVGIATSTPGGTTLVPNLAAFVNVANSAIFIASNNVGTIAGGSFASGSVVCVAVDLTNQRIWFRAANALWNNSSTADPSANIGGVDTSSVFASSATFPIVTFTGTGLSHTANFGATVFANAVPAGFSSWSGTHLSSPLGTFVTTTKSNVLAANAAVGSDSSTWNGGGSGAGWSPFKLTATLSSPQPGMAGYIHARVRAAKPSVTYYIDPMVVLS